MFEIKAPKGMPLFAGYPLSCEGAGRMEDAIVEARCDALESGLAPESLECALSPYGLGVFHHTMEGNLRLMEIFGMPVVEDKNLPENVIACIRDSQRFCGMCRADGRIDLPRYVDAKCLECSQPFCARHIAAHLHDAHGISIT